MNDPRYQMRYAPASGAAAGRRSPPLYNPARTSLPLSVNYSNLYGGDISVLPSSANNRYSSIGSAAGAVGPTPRTYPVSTSVPTSTFAPPAASRASYMAPKDARDLPPTTARTRRSSTIDSTGSRPVIVTTTTNPSRHGSGSHAAGRSGSPIRDDYRASDTQFYTQPASSIRGRTSHRNSYSTSGRPTLEGEEWAQIRERAATEYLQPRSGDHYRRAPPVYAATASTRHPASIPLEYDYEYTNPSDLVRWDLEEHDRRNRRRDSFDGHQQYYRPSVSYTTEHPGGPVSTDLVRTTYNANSGRQYDSRTAGSSRPTGPPLTTWGRDKLMRNGVDVPPAAPAPPPLDPSRRHPDLVGLDRSGPVERRTSARRPVSLYQEMPPHSSHHEEYYRSREDERQQRERRDRGHDREYEGHNPSYVDDGVTNRGFGIRTDSMRVEYGDELPPNPTDLRRTAIAGSSDPKRRSDDEIGLERVTSRDDPQQPDDSASRRERRRRDRENNAAKGVETQGERRGSKEDEDEGERKKFRDRVSSGIGAAATAIGLGGVVKNKEEKEEKGKERERDVDGSPRRRRAEDSGRRRDSDELEPQGSRAAERYTPRDGPSAAEPSDSRPRRRSPPEEDDDLMAFHRRETEAKLNGTAIPSSSRDDSPQSADDGKPRTSSRRHRSSNNFNPNDAQDLRDLREELAALKLADGSSRSTANAPPPAIVEPSSKSDSNALTPTSSDSPIRETSSDTGTLVRAKDRDGDSRDRGRSLGPPDRDERQVRVVSPPRADPGRDSPTDNGREDKKPIRGILKQPSAKFPEEPNPVREGVAPHKDDKKAKDVPPGARWTKVNRRIINPEALTIGKERFEVRDDFVIVLRVLNKEEIQAYANATTLLRERRRKQEQEERDRDRDRDDERDQDKDRDRGKDRENGEEDERRRVRRYRRSRDDDEYRDEDGRDDEREYDRENDRGERRRRYRREEEAAEDDDSRPSRHEHHHHHHHHRSNRDRDRDRSGIASGGD